MSQPLDRAALHEASAVLRRLAELVEDGVLTTTTEAQFVAAAYWQGAADALSAVAKGDLGGDGGRAQMDGPKDRRRA